MKKFKAKFCQVLLMEKWIRGIRKFFWYFSSFRLSLTESAWIFSGNPWWMLRYRLGALTRRWKRFVLVVSNSVTCCIVKDHITDVYGICVRRKMHTRTNARVYMYIKMWCRPESLGSKVSYKGARRHFFLFPRLINFYEVQYSIQAQHNVASIRPWIPNINRVYRAMATPEQRNYYFSSKKSLFNVTGMFQPSVFLLLMEKRRESTLKTSHGWFYKTTCNKWTRFLKILFFSLFLFF